MSDAKLRRSAEDVYAEELAALKRGDVRFGFPARSVKYAKAYPP